MLGPSRKCVAEGGVLGHSQWFGLCWAYPKTYLAFFTTHTAACLFYHQPVGRLGGNPQFLCCLSGTLGVITKDLPVKQRLETTQTGEGLDKIQLPLPPVHRLSYPFICAV